MVQGSDLRSQAESNRFVPREIEADRGVVYDRAGHQLVFNVPRWTVSIVPAALGELPPAERERVMADVAEVVRRPWRSRSASPRVGRAGARDAALIEQDEMLGEIFGGRRSIESFLPRDPTSGQILWAGWGAIPIDRNVSREVAFQLMEAGRALPGVIVERSSVREYPAGPSLAHLLGFTGPIPQEALEDYSARDYRIYDVVGRDALEAHYEDSLRGDKGQRTVMVDVMGRELAEVRIDQPPLAGDNLHLTLELRFQRAVEEALAAGLAGVGARSGAVVAIDPRDGAVRAMATFPTYDNNLFSTGASPDEFVALLSDPDRPLIHRALSPQPPGSTFKLVTAAAALQEGVIGKENRIHDPGVIRLPNQYNPEITYDFVCWLRSGHGPLNVVGALAHSCDVFFYEVAGGYHEFGANQPGLGSDRLAEYARAFGMGRRSEIELFGEASGLVPTARWLAEMTGEVWTTGRTYNMGIGQGDLLVTPLQMANATAAVANGGILYRPHLVERVEPVLPRDRPLPRPGGELARLPVDPVHLAAVREGMRGAVLYGTSQPWLSGLPTEVAIGGKTGTAEVCTVDPETGDCRRDKDGYLLTHAWFVAFAPVEEPEIALAVFVDGSALDRVIQGSEVAAPIAADVLRSYFGLPPRPSRLPTATPCSEGEDCPETEVEGGLDGAAAQDRAGGGADDPDAAPGDAASDEPGEDR
jgi:penicillin-binding protein 2